ncbi:MAG: SDR family oxidoreductase, partial [Pseudomonadota bacterium]
LATIGVTVHRGDLASPETLQAGAQAADAVIHTAFLHDFTRFAACCAMDKVAVETLGAALEGTEKPLLVTAGVAFLPTADRVATESDAAAAPTSQYPRASEAAAAALVDRGVRASVMRLPPSVHGHGDHGFVPILIELARERGFSAYIDEGANLWSAVHRYDAARAYRHAIEQGVSGETFHAVAEDGVPFRDIAEAIATGLGMPCAAISTDVADEHFGWFAPFAALDQPASSAKTREQLGWQPTHPTLLNDIGSARYFEA